MKLLRGLAVVMMMVAFVSCGGGSSDDTNNSGKDTVNGPGEDGGTVNGEDCLARCQAVALECSFPDSQCAGMCAQATEHQLDCMESSHCDNDAFQECLNRGNSNTYCYNYTCSGTPTGEQCFTSMDDYCDSLCQESDPCAQDACTNSCEGNAQLCTPSATEDCSCDDGDEGTRTCNSDGSAWGSCKCAAAQVCEAGEKADCQCSGSEDGKKTCNSTGTGWGECVCAGDQVCTPGATRDCDCTDGSTGEEKCLSDGSAWSACGCYSPSSWDNYGFCNKYLKDYPSCLELARKMVVCCMDKDKSAATCVGEAQNYLVNAAAVSGCGTDMMGVEGTCGYAVDQNYSGNACP